MNKSGKSGEFKSTQADVRFSLRALLSEAEISVFQQLRWCKNLDLSFLFSKLPLRFEFLFVPNCTLAVNRLIVVHENSVLFYSLSKGGLFL